jgi:EAL domain-containing protein (putative c-di-GMP-specific phosphodiesterase class I)/ActR/RegA family two-component response regulator
MYENLNRLLVVDSDPDTTEATRQIGDALDYALATASEPGEFLRLVDEFRPTAIILDLELENCDAVEALHALSGRGCRATIILTGLADARVLAATRKIGENKGLKMADCIEKPIDENEVRSMLTRLRREDRRLRKDDIQEGLDGKQFIAFYQPIVSVADSGGWVVDRVEALVRWQHPKLGIVMPDEFISQAEQCGLICQLTEQVLDQTLKNLRAWREDGLDLRCSVNLPPSLVTDLDFPDRVADAIAEHGIEPRRVSLELTETATMQDEAAAMDILTRLRVKGIGLSLDDFGTGFSSLTRLYQMPFEEMKIDRSLGMNVPRSREANTIVSSLIELAHNLGLKVCTEGVESRAGLDLLEVLKSDSCQGFFISRALPPADISNFIDHWNTKSPASAQQKHFAAVI